MKKPQPQPLTQKNVESILARLQKEVQDAQQASKLIQTISPRTMQTTAYPNLHRLPLHNFQYSCRDIATWLSTLISGHWNV